MLNIQAKSIHKRGGAVNANAGSDSAAAIGSGLITESADGSKYAVEGITINGGTVNARSFSQPAIGSGYCEDLCVKDIIINGGIH